MALEFDEQLSRLEKPDRDDMTNKEYEVFNQNVEFMEKNWGFINNLFKVLPLNASQYIGFLNFKGSLFNPETCYLTNADKEMIGVVKSGTGTRAALPDHPRRCAAGLHQESHSGGQAELQLPLRQGHADGEAVRPVRVRLVRHQARRRDRRRPDREAAGRGLQRP